MSQIQLTQCKAVVNQNDRMDAKWWASSRWCQRVKWSHEIENVTRIKTNLLAPSRANLRTLEETYSFSGRKKETLMLMLKIKLIYSCFILRIQDRRPTTSWKHNFIIYDRVTVLMKLNDVFDLEMLPALSHWKQAHHQHATSTVYCEIFFKASVLKTVSVSPPQRQVNECCTIQLKCHTKNGKKLKTCC